MTVETATFISQLAPANPAAGDNVSEGDDHLRLLKSVLGHSFPTGNKALTATVGAVNRLVGTTMAIQSNIGMHGLTFNPSVTAIIAPEGWTVTKFSGTVDGHYRITHNLGPSTLNAYHVQATLYHNNSTTSPHNVKVTKSLNYFDVFVHRSRDQADTENWLRLNLAVWGPALWA